jgi:exodeoxyribonuclease VII large subunit
MSPSSEPPDWALPNWETADRRIARPPTTRTTGPTAPAAGLATDADTALVEGLRARILSVSDVTRAVKDALRADDRMRDIWVEGEVGRVTVSTAGHGYFSLQDDRSQLACVFFRDDRVVSPFQPQPGLRVVARGRIDIFDSQGVYQLYVASLQPAGFGDLALRFEALKARLAAEGLFESARKRPLPDRPPVVAVVTSPTGAVWHDIHHVITRRWPLTRVLLVPCLVQGDPAPASIVAALDRVGRWIERCKRDGQAGDAPQVTILARGGGSLEDLWPFNDESVVRAVVRHAVPVVCGVGHEVDVTLADFAADVRAPTPSAAAEMVTPDRVEIAVGLAAQERRLRGVVRARLDEGLREAAAERRALDRLSPTAQLASARERAGVLLERGTRAVAGMLAAGRARDQALTGRLRPTLPDRLQRAGERVDRAAGVLPLVADARLAAARAGLERAGAALGVLGPQATLDRGYAIVRRADDGAIVRDPAEAPDGAELRLRVARGELDAIARGRR